MHTQSSQHQEQNHMPPTIPEIAEKLSTLYERPFGGKPSGRYRISPKMMRKIAGRKKLPDSFIHELTTEMFELGFVFLDMESYYAVASARTFASYRRLGEASLEGTVEGNETKH